MLFILNHCPPIRKLLRVILFHKSLYFRFDGEEGEDDDEEDDDDDDAPAPKGKSASKSKTGEQPAECKQQ